MSHQFIPNSGNTEFVLTFVFVRKPKQNNKNSSDDLKNKNQKLCEKVIEKKNVLT